MASTWPRCFSVGSNDSRPRLAIGFPSCADAISGGSRGLRGGVRCCLPSHADGGGLIERAAIAVERGGHPCEVLPPLDRNINVGGANLDRVAGAAGHFGRDDRGAGTAKRLVNGLPGRGVILDWATHALDRLLRRVAGFGFQVCNLPERRLCAVPLPVTVIAHRVPARFVLNMIMPTPNDEFAFAPYNLRSDFKSAAF